MSKNNIDRKVNRIAKSVNKMLKEDVFGDRFWLRQVRKTKEDGCQYYLYEMKDREKPSRDTLIRGWISGYSLDFFIRSEFFEAMNDFIIFSDFWYKYYLERGQETALPPDKYDKEKREF